jgi:hypothetical protein
MTGKAGEPRPTFLEITTQGSPAVLPRGLDLLAAWAVGEHAATTLAELLALAEVSKPQEVEDAWTRLLTQPLSVFAAGRLHDFSVPERLEELLQTFDERETLILQHRIVVPGRRLSTLDELGTRIGVTRERIRQIEQRVVKLLMRSSNGPIGRRAFSLGARLGSAVPLGSVQLETSLRWATRDFHASKLDLARSVLLFLAGPYKEDKEWLLRVPDEVRLQGTLALLLESVDKDNILVPEEIERILNDAAILETLHEQWMDRLGVFRQTTYGLLRWDGSTSDKLYRLLRLRGVPSTIEELLAQAGQEMAPQHIRSRLMADPRFVRINLQGELALTEWGFDEYTGIADEIVEELERRGGSANVSDLVLLLVDRFGVSENSVRSYVQTPRFRVEGGMVRLRGPHELYEVVASIAETRGCFQLSPARVAWLLTVDADVLRGSGRSLPAAIAAFLGVRPGGERRLHLALQSQSTRTTVPVKWSLTSTGGPSIGSLRSLATFTKAACGSLLRVVFDRDLGTIVAARVNTVHLDRLDPSARITELTGLAVGEHDLIATLASALGVSGDAVRRTLRFRGDGHIADLLPEVEVTSDLHAAIAALGEIL